MQVILKIKKITLEAEDLHGNGYKKEKKRQALVKHKLMYTTKLYDTSANFKLISFVSFWFACLEFI